VASLLRGVRSANVVSLDRAVEWSLVDSRLAFVEWGEVWSLCGDVEREVVLLTLVFPVEIRSKLVLTWL